MPADLPHMQGISPQAYPRTHGRGLLQAKSTRTAKPGSQGGNMRFLLTLVRRIWSVSDAPSTRRTQIARSQHHGLVPIGSYGVGSRLQ